ncbi:hypothetical protein MKW94_005470, partial [Papaver nudicaule]|nr:hypothetical protein [Papaver nudicaule]
GLLRFYRLPLLLEPWIGIPAVVVNPPSLLGPWIGIPAVVVYPPLPERVKFKLNTFP